MKKGQDAPSFTEGLQHINRWAETPIAEKLVMLETAGGSREGLLLTMTIRTDAFALVAWYQELLPTQFLQWSHVSAKLRIMRQHLMPREDYVTEELLWPLISDNEELIDWYRQFDAPYWPDDPKVTGGDKRKPKDWMYYRYQSWLALNHRWGELAERCERILAMQDEIKKDRMYLIDHRFYLALARGQKQEMEAILLEMCQPRMLAMRHKQESGLTNKFIASHATIFAKMAWRNGYQVEIDTPWIPKDWLPIKPNAVYEDPWPFMQRFDIWQPFKQPWTERSPRKPA